MDTDKGPFAVHLQSRLLTLNQARPAAFTGGLRQALGAESSELRTVEENQGNRSNFPPYLYPNFMFIPELFAHLKTEYIRTIVHVCIQVYKHGDCMFRIFFSDKDVGLESLETPSLGL